MSDPTELLWQAEDQIEELKATNEAQGVELERLRGMLGDIVTTLEDPGWDAVVITAHVHGVDYKGPAVSLLSIKEALEDWTRLETPPPKHETTLTATLVDGGKRKPPETP